MSDVNILLSIFFASSRLPLSNQFTVTMMFIYIFKKKQTGSLGYNEIQFMKKMIKMKRESMGLNRIERIWSNFCRIVEVVADL